MKLLILPSHRLLFYHHKMLLTLLPESFQAEQYATLHHHNGHHHHHKEQGHGLIATIHYKTINIYKNSFVRQLAEKIMQEDAQHSQGAKKVHKLEPLVSEVLAKKLEVLDMYQTANDKNENLRECIISDKFGDMYKIAIPTVGQKQSAVYINSNLGIPKYIRHISIDKKQYLFLADEQNRIKIYNSLNPHELLSVWFMINMSSIQCQILYGHEGKENALVVLLVRYYNKLTLETSVRVHYLLCTQATLEQQQYPGIEVKGNKTSLQGCKFYTMLKCKTQKGHAILLLYLFEDKIQYEVYVREGLQLKNAKQGYVQIDQGKWDYLHGIETEEHGVVLLAYGCDVQMPVDIKVQEKQLLEGKEEGPVKEKTTFNLAESNKISLNKYEKLVKIDLGL